MHDFPQLDITGMTGVVKPTSFALPEHPTVKQRSFLVESGPGCLATPGTRRGIRGRWVADKMPDSLSSYDFEYLLGKDGKKIARNPEEVNDVEPVRLTSEITEKPKTVRRKK